MITVNFSLPNLTCCTSGKVESEMRAIEVVHNIQLDRVKKCLTIDTNEEHKELAIHKVKAKLSDINIEYIEGEVNIPWYQNHWLLGGIGIIGSANSPIIGKIKTIGVKIK